LGEILFQASATQFERPGDTVTALGMGMLHATANLEARCRRTAPTDRNVKLRSGMHDHAMRLHVARDTHMLIGRVCNHAERIVANPTLDEVVVAALLGFTIEQLAELRSVAALNAQILQPTGE